MVNNRLGEKNVDLGTFCFERVQTVNITNNIGLSITVIRK